MFSASTIPIDSISFSLLFKNSYAFEMNRQFFSRGWSNISGGGVSVRDKYVSFFFHSRSKFTFNIFFFFWRTDGAIYYMQRNLANLDGIDNESILSTPLARASNFEWVFIDNSFYSNQDDFFCNRVEITHFLSVSVLHSWHIHLKLMMLLYSRILIHRCRFWPRTPRMSMPSLEIFMQSR